MSGPLGSQQWMYNAGGGFYPYSIDQSLRFNDGDSPFLKRDITTTSNAKTWTWSAWVKRSTLTTRDFMFSDGKSSSLTELEFQANGTLYAQVFDGGARNKVSTQVFRDASAWYHVVWRVDTTQATAADRNRVYINGEQITDWSTENHPTQNADTTINVSGNDHIVGAYSTGSNNFDGYMAEVHFVDGTSLDPTSFGETINGIWVPKEVSGLTYGTNGFYLPFAQDTTSGNSIQFDSGSDQVQHSDTTAYDIGSSDDFTIEFFMKSNEVGGGSSYGNILGQYATGGPHHLISYDVRNATRKLTFYSGNGQALQWDVTVDETFNNNTWYHVVFQRNGTTLRAYFNGTRLTSVVNLGSSWTLSNGKATNFNASYNLDYIRLGNIYNSNAIIGSLSNVRYVIGSSVYADDDNNITVPTSSLTAVTNTKLLTAVNSTLGDDISTLNNDGSVSGATLSYDSPFTISNFFDDASGNNNDFTANNLVTSDIVPDSPTLNYPTWNPLVNTGQSLTFAEGNLNLDASGTFWSSGTWNQSTMGVLGGSDAKYYFEFTMNGNTSGSYVIGVGRQNSSAIDTTHYTGGVVYYYNRCSSDSTDTVTGLTIASSLTIIRLAFDASNGKVWIGDNTGWFNSGDPAAGTGEVGTISGYDGEMLVAILNRSTNTGDQVVNFGQDDTFAGFKTSGSASATDDNGYGTFYYTPPTGFLALNSASLPEATIGPNSTTTSDEHFDTVLYTGTLSSSGVANITHNGGFTPDFVWTKSRSASQNILRDSVRGANLALLSETAAAESDKSGNGNMTALATSTTFATNYTDGLNTTGKTFVAWLWKAGGTAVSNTDGSITSSVSANTDAGFSIVSFTCGSGVTSGTVGHGLGVQPQLIIGKTRNHAVDWYVQTPLLAANLTGILNTTSAWYDPGYNHWNDTHPTDTVFSVGGYMAGHADLTSPSTKICYCFANVEGHQKVGLYVGNGSTDGTFVYTGFRPAFVLTKESSSTSGWNLRDIKRSPENVVNEALQADTSGAELTSGYDVDFLSNGFKLRTSLSDSNTSGQTYIYLAFAEAPFKYANAR